MHNFLGKENISKLIYLVETENSNRIIHRRNKKKYGKELSCTEAPGLHSHGDSQTLLKIFLNLNETNYLRA